MRLARGPLAATWPGRGSIDGSGGPPATGPRSASPTAPPDSCCGDQSVTEDTEAQEEMDPGLKSMSTCLVPGATGAPLPGSAWSDATSPVRFETWLVQNETNRQCQILAGFPLVDMKTKYKISQ